MRNFVELWVALKIPECISGWFVLVNLPFIVTDLWHTATSWGQAQYCTNRSKQEETYCKQCMTTKYTRWKRKLNFHIIKINPHLHSENTSTWQGKLSPSQHMGKTTQMLLSSSCSKIQQQNWKYSPVQLVTSYRSLWETLPCPILKEFQWLTVNDPL